MGNTVAEPFFGSSKKERIKKRIYAGRQTATLDVSEYTEGFYNPIRRHSHLDGVSPIEFEAAHRSHLENAANDWLAAQRGAISEMTVVGRPAKSDMRQKTMSRQLVMRMMSVIDACARVDGQRPAPAALLRVHPFPPSLDAGLPPFGDDRIQNAAVVVGGIAATEPGFDSRQGVGSWVVVDPRTTRVAAALVRLALG